MSWHHLDKVKPDHDRIVLVATVGNITLVRDLAWYDGEKWENLKGESIDVILWCDEELPTIPHNFYFHKFSCSGF